MGRHPNRAATEDDFEFDPPVAQSGQPKTTKLHCPFCTLSWTKQVDYNRHLVTHKHTKPYACKHKGCRKSFSQKTALITHWNTQYVSFLFIADANKPLHLQHGSPPPDAVTQDAALHLAIRHLAPATKRRHTTPPMGTSVASAIMFPPSLQGLFQKDAIEDHFVDAREYCASAYAELVTKGEVSEEDSLHFHPSSAARTPKYEPSYTGDFSSESAVTSSPKFYRASEDPLINRPPPQYTPHDLSSPGRRFDYSLNLSRMSSPTYDAHDMNGRMIGSSYGPGCLPTGDSPFSTIILPGHTGNYSISTPHISSSPL
ncbi:C2H2 zinc finger [Ceratobasidium sp. AG-Ba]|nr:C2H2 zinc finger [Ceratobasidium sp. AG-Ba]